MEINFPMREHPGIFNFNPHIYINKSYLINNNKYMIILNLYPEAQRLYNYTKMDQKIIEQKLGNYLPMRITSHSLQWKGGPIGKGDKHCHKLSNHINHTSSRHAPSAKMVDQGISRPMKTSIISPQKAQYRRLEDKEL